MSATIVITGATNGIGRAAALPIPLVAPVITMVALILNPYGDLLPRKNRIIT